MDVKRILIFSLAYYPRVGGAEVAIKEITDRILREDIAFDMITLRFDKNDPDVEMVGNVRVYRVKYFEHFGYVGKAVFPLLAAIGARRLHKKNHYDAAWAMMSYMLLPLVLANLKTPYALTLQEGDTTQHMFGRLRILPFLPLLNAGFRRAKVVQAISTYLGGWARERGFVGPLEVIPNGVDIQKFSGEKIKHEGTVLIHTGRLVHKNALDDVIRALPEVPEVNFVAVGDGPDKEQLEALAQKLGVAERVRFVKYVDHTHLPALLHAADIFIRPSRSEGMGNSFVEAFAAGLPVIATQEGGLADFITPGVAWPVKKDNPAQIVLQIKAILGNPEHTKKVIENARKLAVEKYNWELIARDMRDKVFARLF